MYLEWKQEPNHFASVLEGLSLTHYAVSVARRIDAPPERVYNLIIDMDEHRRILPRQFESLDVLEGGKGDGTVFRLTMNVTGNRTTLEMKLSELEPGRVVQERDIQAGITTIWELTPEDGGRSTLRITSEFPDKPGLSGWVERLVTSSMIRKIYRQELENINRYLTTGAGTK
jgi:uncharacterized protein YndB with AHSA1/START domain